MLVSNIISSIGVVARSIGALKSTNFDSNIAFSLLNLALESAKSASSRSSSESSMTSGAELAEIGGFSNCGEVPAIATSDERLVSSRDIFGDACADRAPWTPSV